MITIASSSVQYVEAHPSVVCDYLRVGHRSLGTIAVSFISPNVWRMESVSPFDHHEFVDTIRKYAREFDVPSFQFNFINS